MRSELPVRHPLAPLWQLSAAAIPVSALNNALELELFRALETPADAPSLAARFDLDPDNTRHLLTMLWSLGLLERRRPGQKGETRYLASPLALRYFLRESPSYCGDTWLFRSARMAQTASDMARLLRQGAPIPAEDSPSPRENRQWADAARNQLAQDQQAISAPAALALLQRLHPSGDPLRLLDLGGGPGWIAIALAEAREHLSGVVFDLPESVAVAAANITARGLGQRLAVRAGSLEQGDLGRDYDLIWCSSVLHFVRNLPAALQHVWQALAPGGTFVCIQAEIPDEPGGAMEVLPYYLPMMLQGRQVTRQGDLARQMAACGFREITQETSGSFPLAPLQIVVGRRPR